MTSKIYDKQMKCYHSRQGVVNPQLCGSDWCNHCSRPRTDWLIQEANTQYVNSPQLYFNTGLLTPTRSEPAGRKLAIDKLKEMAVMGVEGMGVYEFGNTKDTPAWNNMIKVAIAMTNKKYYSRNYQGIPHLHWISSERYEVLKELFLIKDQVMTQEMCVGVWKDQSHEDAVKRSMMYCRKRGYLFEAEWFKFVTGEQLVFKLSGGVLYIGSGGVWSEDCDNGDVMKHYDNNLDTDQMSSDEYASCDNGDVMNVWRGCKELEGESGERVTDCWRNDEKRVRVVSNWRFLKPDTTDRTITKIEETESLKARSMTMHKAFEVIERIKQQRLAIQQLQDTTGETILNKTARHNLFVFNTTGEDNET